MRYVELGNILSKVNRDTALEVAEADVVEWAGEALGLIGAFTQYEQAVAFAEVSNHQAMLPAGLVNIIQIARSNCQDTGKNVCAKDVVPEPQEEEEKWPVPIDCNGQPVADYDLAYYRPYFDLIYEYEGWAGSTLYRNCYSPVRLADHSFFNSVVLDQGKGLYDGSRDEYTIVDPYLRFSFREGLVAIAYTKPRLGPNGWPMVPDIESYREAIVRFVRYKMALRKFDMEISNASLRYLEKAESDWQWYCKQAGNVAMMPKGEDDMQDLLEQKSYMLPRQHRYYGFFGRMNQMERRYWNYDSNINLFRSYRHD